MCFFGGGDGPDALKTITPKARKAHKCEGCGATIAPGEKYELTKALIEGDWETHKACLACVAAIEEFGDAHDGYPFPAYFREALVECVHEGDEESDTKWAPMLAALDARRAATEARR